MGSKTSDSTRMKQARPSSRAQRLPETLAGRAIQTDDHHAFWRRESTTQLKQDGISEAFLDIATEWRRTQHQSSQPCRKRDRARATEARRTVRYPTRPPIHCRNLVGD